MYDVHLVSMLPPQFVARCHFKHVPPPEHEEHLRSLLATSSGRRIGVIPYAGFTMPRQLSVKEASK